MGRPATVDEVQVIKVRGPWCTKSGGALDVLLALDHEAIERYLEQDARERARVPRDIRGLRIYHVHGLPRGQTGGGEFHRVRDEVLIGLTGSTRWTFEDIDGRTRVCTLHPRNGFRVPPFILHTYGVIEEGSSHLVVANTLFDPDDPSTHDTYSTEMFRELQRMSGARAR